MTNPTNAVIRKVLAAVAAVSITMTGALATEKVSLPVTLAPPYVGQEIY